jgi:hypothetical protein
MAPEQRKAEEIRQELSVERAGLTEALATLREDVRSARRIPMIMGGALLAGIATVAAVRKLRD